MPHEAEIFLGVHNRVPESKVHILENTHKLSKLVILSFLFTMVAGIVAATSFILFHFVDLDRKYNSTPVFIYFCSLFVFIPGAMLTMIGIFRILVSKKQSRPRWMLCLSTIFIMLFLIEFAFDIVPVMKTVRQRAQQLICEGNMKTWLLFFEEIVWDKVITSDTVREMFSEHACICSGYAFNTELVGKNYKALSKTDIVLFETRETGAIGSIDDLVEFRHGNQDQACIITASGEWKILHRRHWEALQCVERKDIDGLRRVLDDDEVPYWYRWMDVLPKNNFLYYTVLTPRMELSYWLIPPLHEAIRQEQSEIMELLISRGIGLCAEFDGNTPLTLLSEEVKPEYLRMLIEKGARQTDKTSRSKRTLLHEAAKRGLPGIVDLLIENDADVNSKLSCSYDTPLHEAAFGYHTQKGRWSARDIPIKSPVQLEVVKLLVKNGARVNAKDYSGSTPLHYAAMRWDWEMVAFLIENGARINARDNRRMPPPMTKFKGYTPLDVLADTYNKSQPCHVDFEKTRDILLKSGGILKMLHYTEQFDAVMGQKLGPPVN